MNKSTLQVHLGQSLIIRFFRALLRDRLTPDGRAVFYMILVSNLFGGVNFAVKLYLFICVLVCLGVTSIIAARLARVKLDVHFDIPARATRGVPFQVRFRLHNGTRKTARDVLIWMLRASKPVDLEPELGRYLGHLRPGESVDGVLGVTPPVRGHYVVPGLRQATLFPFGLWRDWYDIESPRAFLAYPQFKKLIRLDIPVGRRYQPGGIALTSNLGDSTEFLSTREFRQGDSLRMIHWRSWARLGKPVVKEFQEEFFCRIALVMDTFMSAHQIDARREEFEAAVEMSAAIADNLAREEYVIDIFAAGPELYHLQAGRSLAHFENVMDILSCVEPCTEPAFEKLEPILLDSLENITTTVVMLLDWDERRERLIQAVRDRGSGVKAILVNNKLSSEAAAHLESRAGEFVHLTTDQIKAGVTEL